MTHLEYQVNSKLRGAKMANIWKDCADDAGPPVLFIGLTVDYQQNGFVQIPTVYVLLGECEDSAAEERRLRPLIDAAIANTRERFWTLKREDLYSDHDTSIGNFESAEHFQIKLFTVQGLHQLRAFDEAEEYRLSPGKNIGARHTAEVSSIDDFSPEEFHIVYRTDEIWGASAGLSEAIKRELIEYCHEIGRVDRTLENTRFVFTSVEEFDQDYIRFYK